MKYYPKSARERLHRFRVCGFRSGYTQVHVKEVRRLVILVLVAEG